MVFSEVPSKLRGQPPRPSVPVCPPRGEPCGLGTVIEGYDACEAARPSFGRSSTTRSHNDVFGLDAQPRT